MRSFPVKSVATTFLLVLVSTAALAGDTLTVRLKRAVTIESDSVKLSDIIDTAGTDIEFARRFGNVTLDLAPDAAAVDHSLVLAALSQAGADLDAIRFTGSGGATLERGLEINLPESARAKITALISSGYGVPAADMTLKTARLLPKPRNNDPQGLTFSDFTALDLSHLNRAKFKATLTDDMGSRTACTLTLNLAVETTVVTAAADLEAGITLTDTDIVSGRAPLTSLSGRILAATDLKGKAFKVRDAIGRDDIITDHDVSEILQIKKGAPVTLTYKTAMISIKATGTLQDDAEVGSVVQAENVDSKRSVTGRLVSKDEVEVSYAN